MNDKPKCFWCSKTATRKDYREIDGITSKILTCEKCVKISTESLLNIKYSKSK